MLSRTMNQVAQSPWARLVWAGVGVLALIQVAAFYRLCADQVQKAQARETMFLQQRHALTDCLDYMDGSTMSSCSRHAARGVDSGVVAAAARDVPLIRASQAMVNGAVPVSYVFH